MSWMSDLLGRTKPVPLPSWDEIFNYTEAELVNRRDHKVVILRTVTEVIGQEIECFKRAMLADQAEFDLAPAIVSIVEGEKTTEVHPGAYITMYPNPMDENSRCFTFAYARAKKRFTQEEFAEWQARTRLPSPFTAEPMTRREEERMFLEQRNAGRLNPQRIFTVNLGDSISELNVHDADYARHRADFERGLDRFLDVIAEERIRRAQMHALRIQSQINGLRTRYEDSALLGASRFADPIQRLQEEEQRALNAWHESQSFLAGQHWPEMAEGKR